MHTPPLNELRPSASAMTAARQRLEAELGTSKVLSDPDLLEPYSRDWSHDGAFMPDLVVKAESTRDVQRVFAVASEHRIPVTPRGLGSGKSGGALPIAGGIVLSMERMKAVKEISRHDMLTTVEPGMITADLMKTVEAEGLFYPPDPNSLEMCSIGGNVACNAGGPRALKYGVTRNYLLGVEVVIPTGEVLKLGHRTIKGVTGYDLAGLICGSEGTLGVITEITLRVVPQPRAVETALVSFPGLDQASVALTEVLSAGIVPRTLELLDHHALEAVRAKTPGRFPEDAGAVIILETDGPSKERAFEELERAATVCLEQGALDVLVAQSEKERALIWEPRRVLSVTLSETSPMKMSEDIVVPRSLIPEMIRRVTKISERHRVRTATYGHAGDGNLHVNVLFDESSADRAQKVVEEVMAATVALGGTISGEHGIGTCKREFIALEQSAPLIALQKALKAQLDPLGILNPGKIFPFGGVRE
ncbi:FAD-binding protein [Myxococcota bacterium]|nr:FAD-binding protein [Myxococcota bacterium]